MKIENIPFRKFSPNDIARMWLPVTIINPATRRSIKVFGLIDTGADECALPALYAARLGHNLQSGKEKEINTGNGVTVAHSHTVSIKTFDFSTTETLIDFMPNLFVPLLGARSFLNHFILTINYPRQFFSLETAV